MKNRISTFLAGLMAGVVISVLAIVVILPKQMFVVHESKLHFNETIEAIAESAKENKWSIPYTYDLQATMKKNGFEVAPIKVLSLCKPEHANQILSGGDERLAAAMMPCRIAVYEKEGKTFISMLNSGLFSKLMGEKIKTVMTAAANENSLILAPIIKK